MRQNKVLTEAGAVPAVVVWGATGDAVVAQQPITCHFAPQADAADARLEVSGAALTVRIAPCGGERPVNTVRSQRKKGHCCSHPFKTLNSKRNGTKEICLHIRFLVPERRAVSIRRAAPPFQPQTLRAERGVNGGQCNVFGVSWLGIKPTTSQSTGWYRLFVVDNQETEP